MKRFRSKSVMGLAVVLIFAAGYLGLRISFGPHGLGSQKVSAKTSNEVPPTVPVTRGDVVQTIIAPGVLVGTHRVVLSNPVGGRLTEVNVRPGEPVRQGEVLAQLDRVPLEAAVREAGLRVQLAEEEHTQQVHVAELALASALLKVEQAEEDLAQQLLDAEAAVLLAESRLTQARAQYPAITTAEIRLQNAIEAEEVTQVEYQEAIERRDANWEEASVAEGYLRRWEAAQETVAIARADYHAALGSQAAKSEEIGMLEAEIQRAQRALVQLQGGISPLLELEVESARWKLDRLLGAKPDLLLTLALEKARADLATATLVAPFDGVVTEIRATAGESVNAGAGLFVLVDPAAVEVLSTVIEEDLPLVQIGQLVELFLDALPGAELSGRVDRIVPQRLAAADRPLYQVYIAIDGDAAGVVPGLTADAAIVVARQTNVVRLPRALVQAGSTNSSRLQVWEEGRIQEREALFGVRGDLYVEILDGLIEGEQVVGQ